MTSATRSEGSSEELDRIFHHIQKLLHELKAKDWIASVVGENRVVVEKKEVVVDSFDDPSSSSPEDEGVVPDAAKLDVACRSHIGKTKPVRNDPLPASSTCASSEVSIEANVGQNGLSHKSKATPAPAKGGHQPKSHNRLHFPKLSTPTPLSKPRQKFTCNDCGRVFAKIQNLNTHVEVVHEGKRHDCPRCLKPFTRRDVLKSHLQAVHAGVKFKCPDCLKEFSFVGALRYHQKVIHENVKVSRKRTLKVVNTNYGKRRKLRGSGRDDEKYPDFTAPAANPPNVAANESKCAKCDETFKRPRDLRIHGKTVHGDLKYACTQCEKTFTRSTYLRTHVESIHKGLRFDCPECPKRFNQAQTLKNHVKVAHEGQKFDCVKCSKTFTQTASLKKHLETVHMGKRTKCPKCDKEFSEAGSMKVHLASVHDGKRFKCPECPKEFTDPAHVRLHVKSLHQGLRFECVEPDCFKSFAHVSSLKKHVRIHVGDPADSKEVGAGRAEDSGKALLLPRLSPARSSNDGDLAHGPGTNGGESSLQGGFAEASERQQRHSATAAAAEYINNVIYQIVSAANPENKDSHRNRMEDKAVPKKEAPDPLTPLIVPPASHGRGAGGSIGSPMRTRSASQEPFRRTETGASHNWASLRLTSLDSSPRSRGSPLAMTSEPPSPMTETASDIAIHPSRIGPDWGDLDDDKYQIRVDSPLINQNQFATPSVFPPPSMPSIDEMSSTFVFLAPSVTPSSPGFHNDVPN